MKEKFQEENWRGETEALVMTAEQITDDYLRRGFTLSLRQLYYQFVARNELANLQSNYEMLGDVVTKARLAGRIDWDAIVDRNRQTVNHRYWESPAQAVEDASRDFRIDKWLDQPNYIEVVIEKAALEGVIQSPCLELEVPFTSSRGYSSSTLLYDMAHRIRERSLRGNKSCHIINLGDLDPSGVDITRDLQDRLSLMSQVPVYVHRVALDRKQVDQYHCPPNPAKLSDSRFEAYKAVHGSQSWELDSLSPEVLSDIVRKSVLMFRDEPKWKASRGKELDMQNVMQDVVDNLKQQPTQ